MRTSCVYKSPDVLVLCNRPFGGLTLVHQANGNRQSLDPQQAISWETWQLMQSGSWDGLVRSLTEKSLVTTREDAASRFYSSSPPISACDDMILRVQSNNVKWYAESPDLCILFNSKSMSQNNPLLALGPYGSLCWRGIIEGRPIRDLRREAVSVFGCDEVLSFLHRLSRLGFIECIPESEMVPRPTSDVAMEFPAPMVQFQLRHSKIPWYCLWEMCTACDLRCQTCYLPHFNNHGPNAKDTLRMADEIIATGIFYVCLLGGEPLIRADLERVVARLRSAGVFVKVITNGQKLTLERARALADAGLNQIEVSLDGLSVVTDEGSRGAGTFARALRGLDCARRANIQRLGIVWTVHSGNVNELPTLPQFMHQLEVRECYVSLFKKTGLNGARAPFEPLDAVATQALCGKLVAWKDVYPELSITLLRGCSCGRTSVVVGYNGDVRTCSFSYKSVGNAYATCLREIWSSLEADTRGDEPLGYCSGT